MDVSNVSASSKQKQKTRIFRFPDYSFTRLVWERNHSFVTRQATSFSVIQIQSTPSKADLLGTSSDCPPYRGVCLEGR